MDLAWDLTSLSEYSATMNDVPYVITAYLPDGYQFEDATDSIDVLVSLVDVEQTALEEALKDFVVDNTTELIGTRINLFDYWSGKSREENDFLYVNSDALGKEYVNTGVNKDKYLKFALNSGYGLGNINLWTGEAEGPCTGIVENKLEGGYPVLRAEQNFVFGNDLFEDGNAKTKRQSLDYLFNPIATSSDTDYKKSFTDVKGLLQIDKDGYYYYNSNKNAHEQKNTFESANYAYFDEDANSFVLYKDWGGSRTDQQNGNKDGQFFPFTTPDKVFELDANGQITQSKKHNVASSEFNHYFGMTMVSRFVQKNGGKTVKNKPVTYEFSGDDDVWVFIDDILVGDLGGIHDPVSVSIDFSTGDIVVKNNNGGEELRSTLKAEFAAAQGENLSSEDWNGNTFADDTYHTLKFFYLERANNESNLSLKFNLQTIPESMINKLDQLGNGVKNAEFKLYVADSIVDEHGNHIGSKIKDENPDPIYVGTTDENGNFKFWNDETNSPYSFREFYRKYNSEYFILRETEVPDGYRPFKDENRDICLHFDSKTGVILSNHYWTTGVFAEPNLTAKAPLELSFGDGNKLKPYEELDQNRDINIFAVVLMHVEKDKWVPVSGSPTEGWKIHDQHGGTYEDVAEAFHAMRENKNVALFEVEAGGVYQGTLEHMPGDIKDYYWYQNKIGNVNAASDAKFTVAYYYSDAATAEEINVANLHLLKSEGFDREFSVSLHIPDIINYFVVEKIDENNVPINGIPFELYEEADIDVKSDGTYETIGKPYREGETRKVNFKNVEKDGMLIFNKLKIGTYYLVEKDIPDDAYQVNKTPIKILVDENGVYADAGIKTDGIATYLEVGNVLKSVRQFAADDGVDNTLHDIKIQQLISDDAVQWNEWDENGETYHFVYNGISDDSPKEYLPFNGGSELPMVEEGWSKISVRQCYTHDAGEGAIEHINKKDIQDLDISGLFSATLFVQVTNKLNEPIDPEPQMGRLVIKKTVTGNAGDTEKLFNFRVKLSDDKLNGKYGEMNFVNGVAEFQLKHNQTISAVLPIGMTYNVEEIEANQDGYATTSTNTDGTISKDDIIVAFVNHKKKVPTDPDKPTEPDKPSEPDKPTEPDKPSEPDKPTEPDKPSEPDKPTEPDKPSEPDKPTEPNKPSEPEEAQPNEDKVPTTDARMNLEVWLLVTLASFAVIVISLFLRKQGKCK